MKRYFTSEQVMDGHPDKICDQISDYILDECLKQDKTSRVAVETMVKDNIVVVAGELTTNAKINIEDCIKQVVSDIGDKNLTNAKIINLIGKQSPDISVGVDTGGAGDQGIMFGYAVRETKEMLPLSYVLATKILQKIKKLNHRNLRSDAKAQVTVCYNNYSIEVETFLVSVQHSENINQTDVVDIIKPLVDELIEEYELNKNFKLLINPTGVFTIGGSVGDCGVTGRKIIADTYGGYGRHGGGAFSGKDFTKVDRSAAYMARYLAKKVLSDYEEFDSCEIQLSYAIGVAKPLSISVVCDGCYEQRIAKIIGERYDLSPKGIEKFLNLKNVEYYKTAKFGHFINQEFNWERV